MRLLYIKIDKICVRDVVHMDVSYKSMLLVLSFTFLRTCKLCNKHQIPILKPSPTITPTFCPVFHSNGRLQNLRLALSLQPSTALLSLSLSSESFHLRLLQNLLLKSGPFTGFSSLDTLFVCSIFLIGAEDEVAPSEGGGEVLEKKEFMRLSFICSLQDK